MLSEDDCGASTADLSLQRRGRSGRDKETRERAQETRGGDIKFRFEIIEMFITALTGGEVHEVPREKRIRQREVAVNARCRKRIAVEVNALFKIAAFGDAPIAGQGMMTDISEE